MRWLIGIVVVIVVGVGYLTWKNLQMPETTGLVDGRLHPCPKSLNCVCCCHDNTAHYIEPLPFSSSDTLDRIQAFMNSHYNVQVVQRTPDYLHLVVTTPMMRFKDDVEFAVDHKKNIVRVRSASRVGSSDFGVNRKRIEAVRSYLNGA